MAGAEDYGIKVKAYMAIERLGILHQLGHAKKYYLLKGV
jgi:hypothetical protein